VIIGGTAEEYWSLDEYHGRDLDLCASVGPEPYKTLKSLGFDRAGRHWEHAAAGVAVEFPESEVDGDMARTVEVKVARSIVRIIGVEDLYVDRVRQATADENDYGRFESALAIAVATVRGDRLAICPQTATRPGQGQADPRGIMTPDGL